jgi:hypothetical protein
MSAAAAACLRLLLATGVIAAATGKAAAGEAAGAARGQEAVRAPRVRLLVPTLADLTELAVLLRGELTAAGFRVEERAVPAGPLTAWLTEARRDGVMAVVALDPAPARAHVWLLTRAQEAAAPATAPALSAPVILSEPGPAGRAGEAAASRARTTLAVRIAERLRAALVAVPGVGSGGTTRSSGVGDAGTSPRTPISMAVASATSPRAAEAGAATQAPVPGGLFPSPSLASLARPLPSLEFGTLEGSRAPREGAPAAKPPAPRAQRGEVADGRRLRLEGVFFAGRGLHPDAAALGVELALARGLGTHGLVRLGLTERSSPREFSAPAGTARPFETALLATVGLAPRLGRSERLVPELALGLGVQHTLLLGQGAAGFDGHSAGSVAAVLTARAGLRVALGRRTALLVAARLYRVLPQPVVVLDDVTASRAGPGFEAGLGLAFGD